MKQITLEKEELKGIIIRAFDRGWVLGEAHAGDDRIEYAKRIIRTLELRGDSK